MTLPSAYPIPFAYVLSVFLQRLSVNMKSVAFLFMPTTCAGIPGLVPADVEHCGAGGELATRRGGEGLLDATRGTEYIFFGSSLGVLRSGLLLDARPVAVRREGVIAGAGNVTARAFGIERTWPSRG